MKDQAITQAAADPWRIGIPRATNGSRGTLLPRHPAPTRQRSRHFGTTRLVARIEMLVTPIPSTKHQFLIATICRSVEDRHPESEHREPRDLLATTVTANKRRKANKNLIATTSNSKIAPISSKQRTSQKLIATRTPLPLHLSFASYSRATPFSRRERHRIPDSIFTLLRGKGAVTKLQPIGNSLAASAHAASPTPRLVETERTPRPDDKLAWENFFRGKLNAPLFGFKRKISKGAT